MQTRSLLIALLLPGIAAGFSVPTTTDNAPASTSPIFEFLKWGGSQPDFDVLQKTEEYVNLVSVERKTPGREWFHPDYVLRGPVIGPLTRKDLVSSQKGFQYDKAFPDFEIDTFGYTIDPENPYRCFYFQRWRGTHLGTLMAGEQAYEATGNYMETPVSVFCVVWTPDQNIIYEQVGAVVDRFEGNTEGKAAVFGLFHTAGLKLPAGPGNPFLRFLQRLGHTLDNGGRSFSREEDIPSWWTSKSRGADPTDSPL